MLNGTITKDNAGKFANEIQTVLGGRTFTYVRQIGRQPLKIRTGWKLTGVSVVDENGLLGLALSTDNGDVVVTNEFFGVYATVTGDERPDVDQVMITTRDDHGTYVRHYFKIQN